MGTEVVGVSKSFGEFKALDNVSLTINKGEFVAILGPSGCGKTTLLRLIAGFEKPSKGRIIIKDTEVSNDSFCIPPEKRNIGMVFQSFALWPHMTIYEHLKFPIDNHRYVDTAIKKNSEEEIMKILKLIGLENMAHRFPSQLSGGQKQRVALARAIIAKPDLLLMDEPLSALDAELRMEMRHEIQNIHRIAKVAIVYVTHDQGEALAMADKMVIMREGKIEQVGSPREVYNVPKTEFVAKFVSKANIAKGKWINDKFIINNQNKKYVFEDRNISKSLKEKHIFPIRPDQLYLSKEDNGIPCLIKNIQFQGSDIHYLVENNQDIWSVYMNKADDFDVGDKVYLRQR